MGRLMRENYWLAFALSSHLVAGDAPLPVRLLGQNYIAFRAEDGRVGFLDELCPHRRASLALGRIEGNGVRCIYHGWKIDVSGCVVEAPTQVSRPTQFAANVRVTHFPVHETGGVAWVWLGGADAPAFPDLPFADENAEYSWMTSSRVPCNWLQGVEGTIDSSHVGVLHQTWHREAAKLAEHANLAIALDYAPRYETETTSYGMRAAALRRTADGSTYVRITEHLLPLVTVVSVGRAILSTAPPSSSLPSTTPTTSSSSGRSPTRPSFLQRRRPASPHPVMWPTPTTSRDSRGTGRTAGAKTANSWPRGTSPVSGETCSKRTRRCRRAWGRSLTAPRRTSARAMSPSPTPVACSSKQSAPPGQANCHPEAREHPMPFDSRTPSRRSSMKAAAGRMSR